VLRSHDRIVHTVAFSPDGRFVATASGDGTVALASSGPTSSARWPSSE
jgi:WD40 repeat protein